jgi:hypothetical protein
MRVEEKKVESENSSLSGISTCSSTPNTKYLKEKIVKKKHDKE